MLPYRPIRASRRPWISPILALMIAIQAATPAWAWGKLGHRVAARLAERNLNPKAKASIAALLEEGESLSDCSTWADEHRRDIKESGPWHYVDVPLDAPRYDARFSGPEAEKGCIVDKIAEFKAILKDPKRPVEQRRFALRFLVHLIGDLHTPLHVGDNRDRGGNDTQVRFFENGTNMHALWDSGLLERSGDTEDFWLADLVAMDTSVAHTQAMDGAVEDWATESLLAARAAYQDPATRQRIKPGSKLGDAYVEANLPVARKRLYQSGIRLAMVLNELLGAE